MTDLEVCHAVGRREHPVRVFAVRLSLLVVVEIDATLTTGTNTRLEQDRQSRRISIGKRTKRVTQPRLNRRKHLALARHEVEHLLVLDLKRLHLIAEPAAEFLQLTIRVQVDRHGRREEVEELLRQHLLERLPVLLELRSDERGPELVGKRLDPIHFGCGLGESSSGFGDRDTRVTEILEAEIQELLLFF